MPSLPLFWWLSCVLARFYKQQSHWEWECDPFWWTSLFSVVIDSYLSGSEVVLKFFHNKINPAADVGFMYVHFHHACSKMVSIYILFFLVTQPPAVTRCRTLFWTGWIWPHKFIFFLLHCYFLVNFLCGGLMHVISSYLMFSSGTRRQADHLQHQEERCRDLRVCGRPTWSERERVKKLSSQCLVRPSQKCNRKLLFYLVPTSTYSIYPLCQKYMCPPHIQKDPCFVQRPVNPGGLGRWERGVQVSGPRWPSAYAALEKGGCGYSPVAGEGHLWMCVCVPCVSVCFCVHHDAVNVINDKCWRRALRHWKIQGWTRSRSIWYIVL